MASPTKIQFIEQALSSDSPFNLSYLDPNQKWMIRNHLLSFLQDFPTFTPNFGSYVHNNGMAVNLLCVTGELHISANTPLVPITIWIHENHPFMAPLVIVSPNYGNPIRRDHPFVYLSGSTTCPYLQTWAHPRCSLSILIRNLTRLFTHDHPLTPSPEPATVLGSGGSSNFTHPSRVSKREALDRLAGAAYYDVAKFKARAKREIEELRKLRAEMTKRVEFGERMVGALEREKEDLKNRATEFAEQADVVTNWLRFNDREELVAAITGDEIEKAFESVEPEHSDSVLEYLACDKAIEDTIYAMDKAIEMGVVSFESYVKQIRSLAREQFYKRALLVKFRGSNVLQWTN
ncbi:protein ELC isoform X2 [Humulus lupulus]|uniref:protein ELC isoform X2 n=1 Tax=Humulus lupulus TaxID=3486 RepID=UPI002B40C6AA|nr:protein ELC isoform X2 [Humulus lupulus]